MSIHKLWELLQEVTSYTLFGCEPNRASSHATTNH